MRLLIYMLLPVPLALVGVTVIALFMGGSSFERPEGLFGFLIIGLLVGYQLMGLQSLLFALAMVWLERRGIDRGEQAVIAAVLGAIAGWSILLLGDYSVTLFVIVGSLVGPMTIFVADAVLGYRQSGDVVAEGDEVP